MALEYAVYQTNNMESGKFYFIELNKDLAPNLRLVTTITEPLSKAVLDIETLNQTVNGILLTTEQNKEIIFDNQARINNLENVDLRTKFLTAMELSSIKKNFSDTQEITIEYGRKEILAIRVNALISSSDNKLIYSDITSTVNIENEITLNSEGNPIIKKIVIKSNQPISGYVLVL